MRRRSLALDDAAALRLRKLADFYQASHSAVARLAIANLACHAEQLQQQNDPDALMADRRLISFLVTPLTPNLWSERGRDRYLAAGLIQPVRLALAYAVDLRAHTASTIGSCFSMHP